MHCGIYTYPANLMKILKKYALFKEYGVETKYHFVFLELENSFYSYCKLQWLIMVSLCWLILKEF